MIEECSRENDYKGPEVGACLVDSEMAKRLVWLELSVEGESFKVHVGGKKKYLWSVLEPEGQKMIAKYLGPCRPGH